MLFYLLKNYQLNLPLTDIEILLNQVKTLVTGSVPQPLLRWYSIKLFERDPRVLEQLMITSKSKYRA